MQTFRKYLLPVFLIWTTLAVFDFAGDYFNAVLWEREFFWKEEIPFVTSWYIWFLLTPLALFSSERWKYSEVPLREFIFVHLTGYLVINALQVLLASWYINQAGHWFDGAPAFKGVLYKTGISGSFYNFVIYAIILLIVNSISYYGKQKAAEVRSLELENKLGESRLQFLKQQLQPHFLFNTHHSIITLMKIGERDKAIQMMEKMSELMRFALRDSAVQNIPLEKELELAELYLGIQKIRFEDRLTFIITIPPHLEMALVPTMILQPLIENSVKYSLETDTSDCLIEIDARNEHDLLVLSIKDPGNIGKLPFIKGIGLTNTEGRLRQLYRESFHFSVGAGEGGTGCVATIKIPLHYG